MRKIRFYFCLTFVLFGCAAKAQQAKSKLEQLQDSLIRLSTSSYSALTDDVKSSENGKFVKMLVEALKEPNSFNYGFDSVKTISIVKSPDQVFRIISWYVQQENGTYRYYGTIQMNNNRGPLKLFPLIDQTENLPDAKSHIRSPVASSNIFTFP